VVEAGERLQLPTDHAPQLDEVSALLAPHSGYRYLPAAGLVELRTFYATLADRCFWSTQYLRHASQPLYTPEPDLIHEVIGHATTLASARLAALYVAAGQAARRVESTEALEFVSKVFWFSLEFGVLREGGEPKAYGAGLLSSYGEIEEFVDADLRRLDIAAMGTQTYDITHYQPILFCGDSLQHVEDVVGGFFTAVDDDLVERLTAPVGARG
jgi:phenylalanine-4-hydroxylase